MSHKLNSQPFIVYASTAAKSGFLGHLLRDDLINPVKISVSQSVRTSTMNAATNQIGLVPFVKFDETFTTNGNDMTFKVSEVRVKVRR